MCFKAIICCLLSLNVETCKTKFKRRTHNKYNSWLLPFILRELNLTFKRQKSTFPRKYFSFWTEMFSSKSKKEDFVSDRKLILSPKHFGQGAGASLFMGIMWLYFITYDKHMRLDCLEHVRWFTSGSAVHRVDCRWWETVDEADTQKCIARSQ